MDLDHNRTENNGIKIFLMRGQKKFEFSRTCFFSCSKTGIFDEFQILAVFTEFSARIWKMSNFIMSSDFICLGKYVYSHFFSKNVGVFVSPLPCNRKFKCCVHIFRGPWLRSFDVHAFSFSKTTNISTFCFSYLDMDKEVHALYCMEMETLENCEIIMWYWPKLCLRTKWKRKFYKS